MHSRVKGEFPQRSFTLLRDEMGKQIPRITLLVVLAILGTGIGLIQPLLFKVLLDTAIPDADVRLIALLLVGMVIVPIFSAGLNSTANTCAPTSAKALPNAYASNCSTICCTSDLSTWSSSRPESISIDLLAAVVRSAKSTSVTICCR